MQVQYNQVLFRKKIFNITLVQAATTHVTTLLTGVSLSDFGTEVDFGGTPSTHIRERKLRRVFTLP